MPEASESIGDQYRLPEHARPIHYDLELAPDLEARSFSGRAEITVEMTQACDSLVLHALDLDITHCEVRSAAGSQTAVVESRPSVEQIVVRFDDALEAGTATLLFEFSGELNDKLVGFYRSTFTDTRGDERTIACTQFESTHARRAFPCWDEPAFKASFSVALIVSDDLMAVSNGAQVSSEPLGDDRKRVTFAPTISMSTYLVAFVVGPLEASEPVIVDGTPIRVIAPVGKLEYAPFALDAAAFSLGFLAHWYGIAYPADKLDLIAIPDFAFGAMENMGCVTFRETALLVDPSRATQAEQQRVVDVVAHEIAHMWFGNLVTMGWWNGIWLNEAFATFMEMLTTDAYRPEWNRWADFGLARTAAFDTDSLAATRPIEYEVVTAADSEGMFDILTYEKGASVVRMLQQYLGEDRFQAGIRHYLSTNAGGNTDTTDLWDAIEEATGEPVREIMDGWIFQAGYPVVSVSVDQAMVTLDQEGFRYRPHDAWDDPSGQGAPKGRQVPVVLSLGGGDSPDIHRLLLGPDGARIAVESPPTWVVANHRSNGFYRANLDADALGALCASVGELSALERYSLLDDRWALLLGDQADLASVLQVVHALRHDDDLAVWQRIVGVAAGIDRVAPDPARPLLARWVADLVGPKLAEVDPRAEAGNDPRLSALRGALFEAMGDVAGDSATKARAREVFTSVDSASTSEVDPDLFDAAVSVVASDSDQATWDEFSRRAQAARTPQDRTRYQAAMTQASDPDLVAQFCRRSLTDEVRTQDAPFLIRSAMANRHGTEVTWNFVANHWDEIVARFPAVALARMLEGIRSVTTVEGARAVDEFLAAHPLDPGAKVVAQHRERMWVTVGLATRVGPEIESALT